MRVLRRRPRPSPARRWARRARRLAVLGAAAGALTAYRTKTLDANERRYAEALGLDRPPDREEPSR